MSKKRYKLTTSLKLKIAHKKMVNKFDVRQVSTSRNKKGEEFIYFSVKEEAEQKRIEDFLNGVGVKYGEIQS